WIVFEPRLARPRELARASRAAARSRGLAPRPGALYPCPPLPVHVRRRSAPRPDLAQEEAMPAADHHSDYLAEAVAALTPEGRARVDELLEELAEAAGGRERLVRFAGVRRVEADTGRTEPDAPDELTRQELDAVRAGFMAIRDGETLDDVANWA